MILYSLGGSEDDLKVQSKYWKGIRSVAIVFGKRFVFRALFWCEV